MVLSSIGFFVFFLALSYPDGYYRERWTLMQQPGRWLTLRKPIPSELTRAARKIKTHNEFKRFYHEHGPIWGKPYDRVFCVKWSQDPSFYCCPRDIECDPASGWEPCEEIELFSRRKEQDNFFNSF